MTADDSWAIIEISDIRFSPRVHFLIRVTTLRLIVLNMLQYGGNMQFDLILSLLLGWISVCLWNPRMVTRIPISVINIMSCWGHNTSDGVPGVLRQPWDHHRIYK